MKIRTDFVTNSSSSSFIFEKGADFQKIKKEAEEIFQQLLREEKRWLYDGEIERNQYFLDRLEDDYWFKRISALDMDEQEEVFGWYRNDRMEQIMDREPEDVKQWSEQAKLDYFHDAILELSYRRYVEENGTIDYYKVLENLWEVYEGAPWCSWNIKEDEKNERLQKYEQFIEDHYEELANYCIQLQEEGVTSGILLERFFHSEYILYDDLESPWLMSEALGKTKGCLWSCNHMG